MDYKITRATTRIPKELHDKIKLFKREDNLKSINEAIIKLVELGLIRYQENRYDENLLLKISKQLSYIIEILEEDSNGE